MTDKKSKNVISVMGERLKIHNNPPKKPFKNIIQAKKSRLHYKVAYSDDKSFFPCLCCFGSGEIIDPNEQRDPVEGHKLSHRITCPRCEGTLKSSKHEFMDWYRSEMDNYREEKKEYDEEVARVKEIARKLSKDDIMLLKKYL